MVENRPGAGSIIGTDAVREGGARRLHAAADVEHPHDQRIADPEQAVPADARFRAGGADQLFRPGDGRASVGAGAKDLKEFIALAKKEPGKLNYASSGPGTPYHMAGELFKAMSGTDIVHVPHKASGDARNSVIGGHVQMMFDAITTMAQGAKAGQVRALGTTGKQALAGDAGRADGRRSRRAGLRGDDLARRHGAERHAEAEVVDKLNAEINKVIEPAGREGGLGQAGRGADAR